MSAPRLLNRQKEERYEITYLYITIFYTDTQKVRDKDNRQFNRLIKYYTIMRRRRAYATDNRANENEFTQP